MMRRLFSVWELDILNATELQCARRLLAGVLGDRRIECNRASACKEAVDGSHCKSHLQPA